MKKIIFSSTIIFLLLFIYPASIFADSIDLLNGCGNAESSGAAKLCCKSSIIPNGNDIANAAKSIPFLGLIGGQLDSFLSQTSQITSEVNITPCFVGYPSNPSDPNCICLKESEVSPQPIESMKQMCERYITTAEKNDCIDCAVNKSGVWTSIGCIYGNISKFITEKVLGWGIGVAGFMSLICIIFAAFQMQTSRGNPEKIKKAQELLTSCIIGLLLIIFSTFILRVIGVTILKIPGFN